MRAREWVNAESRLFHPTHQGGKCRLCDRHHRAGLGCPKWRKMTDSQRRAWRAEHKEGVI